LQETTRFSRACDAVAGLIHLVAKRDQHGFELLCQALQLAATLLVALFPVDSGCIQRRFDLFCVRAA